MHQQHAPCVDLGLYSECAQWLHVQYVPPWFTHVVPACLASSIQLKHAWPKKIIKWVCCICEHTTQYFWFFHSLAYATPTLWFHSLFLFITAMVCKSTILCLESEEVKNKSSSQRFPFSLERKAKLNRTSVSSCTKLGTAFHVEV